MNDAQPERLTEEVLFNIRRGLSAAVHLSAAKALAEQVRKSPGGEAFLAHYAQERRAEAQTATAPSVPPAMSMLLAEMKQEVVEEMLRELGL